MVPSDVWVILQVYRFTDLSTLISFETLITDISIKSLAFRIYNIILLKQYIRLHGPVVEGEGSHRSVALLDDHATWNDHETQVYCILYCGPNPMVSFWCGYKIPHFSM